MNDLDDPYYYLYYGDAPRPPSYFTLELEELEVGRVLRFDSFSKILSAGIRIGFVSGPEPLVLAMDLHVRMPTLTRLRNSLNHIPPIDFHSKSPTLWYFDGHSS